MYGTVARIKAKPQMEERMTDHLSEYEREKVPGQVASYVYRTDKDPNEFYLVVLFDSKESYWANAQSPGQDARYRKLLDMLIEEPEWHDGEVVFSQQFSSLGSSTR
jgi:quinol monooxygenase YgiN